MTLFQELDMDGNQIENVENPDQPQDAATKDYVDSNLGGVGDGSDLNFYTDSGGGCPSSSASVSCPEGEVAIAGSTNWGYNYEDPSFSPVIRKVRPGGWNGESISRSDGFNCDRSNDFGVETYAKIACKPK
jgi:hypothetical protein